MYYVTVKIQIACTFYWYEQNLFFDSEESMNKYVAEFNSNMYSLREIVKTGKAIFNDSGMLVEKN